MSAVCGDPADILLFGGDAAALHRACFARGALLTRTGLQRDRRRSTVGEVRRSARRRSETVSDTADDRDRRGDRGDRNPSRATAGALGGQVGYWGRLGGRLSRRISRRPGDDLVGESVAGLDIGRGISGTQSRDRVELVVVVHVDQPP